MFIEKSGICSFADNNLYKSSPSVSVVLNCLEHEKITIYLNWFKVNL